MMKLKPLLLLLFFSLAFIQEAWAANFTTQNFTVTANDPRVAEQMAHRAEFLRKKLAVFWLGKELPPWYKRCKIKVNVCNDSPGGSTSFSFLNGEVYNWDMEIQGTVNRIYDSVLPHEITHTILASHFRTPLPRWADEGAATFTEHQSERDKYKRELYSALKNQRGIPFDRLFSMEEYPEDPFPLYAHASSLAEFLIRQRGPHYYVSFVDACIEARQSWDDLVYEFYGYRSLRSLQEDWVFWLREGTPNFVGTNMIAGNGSTGLTLETEGSDLMQSTAKQNPMGVVPEPRVRPQPNLVMWNTTHRNSSNQQQ